MAHERVGVHAISQLEHGLELNDHDTSRVTGTVKWFDPVKGFGFIVSDDGGPDILLHANVLRNFGQSSVADGAKVEVEVQKTGRGLQVTQVTAIRPPEGSEGAPLADFEDIDAEVIARTPLEPARVKWFDKAKGFGFANIFGKSDDIFIHIEVLRRTGLADLQPGEALALRVVEGRRGLMAMEVHAWEAGLQHSVS